MKNKSMKKVKLLINTAYQGPRKDADVISVPEDFASRWVKNGIAEYVKGEQEIKPEDNKVDVDETENEVDDTQEQEQETEEEPETPDYSSMSAKALYALCKDKGLEVESKQSKEYYIEKLS